MREEILATMEIKAFELYEKATSEEIQKDLEAHLWHYKEMEDSLLAMIEIANEYLATENTMFYLNEVYSRVLQAKRNVVKKILTNLD